MESVPGRPIEVSFILRLFREKQIVSITLYII